MPRLPVLLLLCTAIACQSGCSESEAAPQPSRAAAPRVAAPAPTTADKVLTGARAEVARKTAYLETYQKIDYPNGDVPAEIGVCTDLVIRSFRNAGIDLQKLLHEDRVANPKAYPTHLWQLKKADKYIDHRRCQNLVVFFRRKAVAVPADAPSKWKAGDVIFFTQKGHEFPWHVGVLTGTNDKAGNPLMAHLFPPTAAEDIATRYGPIGGVYRWRE